MKPLYLQGKTGMRVDYEEPALSITQPDKARQLFPLQRVSRVIVSGSVDWTTVALLACADQGISVIFLNECGDVRCRCIGSTQTQNTILGQFETLFERAGSLQSYLNWRVAMERMAVSSAARRLDMAEWQTMRTDVFQHWINRAIPDEFYRLRLPLQSFLHSTVLAYLGDFGLNADYETLLDAPVNLPQDLAGLLIWDFYPALVVLAQRQPCPPTEQEWVGYYEARQARVLHLLRGLMNRLFQCLSELK
jgi:hypothetical protein